MEHTGKESAMDVDEVLTLARPLGLVQCLVTLAACLSQVQAAWIAISTVFISETPQHFCASSTGVLMNESYGFEEIMYGECEEYHIDSSEGNYSTRPCSNGWEYDTEPTGKSIVSDWDLVCARDYLPDLSQSIIVVGFAVGAITAGPLADRFGRRPTQLISLIIFIVVGLFISLSPNYVIYVSLRCTMGAVMMIHKIPLSTMQCEYMIPKHRSIMGSIPFCISALGTILMSGIAYYVRDWRFFNLAILSPSLILMTFLWLIPESVRWIMSKGDVTKAEKTIQKIAKLNRAEAYPSPVFLNYTQLEENKSFFETPSNHDGLIANGKRAATQSNGKKSQSMRQIFKQPTATVTCILSWCWTVNLLTYFGFALSVGTLAGNIYLNFFLIALVELPARTISIIIVKKTGSLLLVIFSYATSGLSMLVIVVLSFVTAGSTLSRWWLTSFALLGKFFVSFSMAPLNLMMNELFPTSVRNSGRGVVQLIGNIGSLLVPLFLYMDKFVPNLTFMVISICTLVCAGLCLVLPETLNTTQPDTPADLQVLFDTKRIIRRRNRGQRIPDENL